MTKRRRFLGVVVDAATALLLIKLTTPGGHELDVNPGEVSSLRAPIDTTPGLWAKGTNCILVMSNGRFNAVAEDCPTVQQKLQEAR